MERKLSVLFMYDPSNNEVSTVYKQSQLSNDSVLIGVFESYRYGEDAPSGVDYMFFENNNLTLQFQVNYRKQRTRELQMQTDGSLYATYVDSIETATYSYELNHSSLNLEQRTEAISQLGFDRRMVISTFTRIQAIRRSIYNQYNYIPYGLAIMSYIDSDKVRDIELEDIEGNVIEEDYDILYTVYMDRITYDLVDDLDLVYAEDVKCYVDYDDAYYIVDADYYVLDTSDYYQCDETSGWYTEDGVVMDDSTTISRELFEDQYFICDNCGGIHHIDYMCYDEYTDLTYCEDCWNNRSSGIIREYHDNPRLELYTTEDTFNGGYGFELEVDNSEKSTPIDLAHEIDKKIEQVWLTRDGSLNNGLEIVSHPMTLDYIMNTFDMNHLCDIIKTHGFKSHNTGTCGLHIHASRELFGKSIEEQELTIAKIMVLFNRFYDNEIVTFSRRRYDRLVQWAKKSSVEIKYNDKTNDISNKLDEARRKGRYQAINLVNKNTVEFRIFRGTNKASTILASIQFVDELINYAKSRSLYVCTLVKFNNIFKKTQHQELKNYLIDRKLMKEEEFKLCV